MMKISAICFTEYGHDLLGRIKAERDNVEAFCKCKALKDKTAFAYVDESIQEWAEEQFSRNAALLFIGACGIAVRAVTPCVNSKLADSPVLVMDDAGRFVIPILSGHVGGANELAAELSRLTGAIPVITTSTDIHGVFAADMFAKEQGFEIINKPAIAPVSAKALRGEQIVIDTPDIRLIKGKVTEEMRNADSPLYLRVREYALGIGCRQGKTRQEIMEVLGEVLEETGIEAGEIFGIASIDIKKDEQGIIELSEALRVPFRTFTSEELNSVPGTFNESEFVREKTGVGNVCERAAIALCEGKGVLAAEKHAKNGVTIAMARKE